MSLKSNFTHLISQENPFSNHSNDESIPIDGDDPQHITWIFEKAQERANNVSILLYGFVKKS